MPRSMWGPGELEKFLGVKGSKIMPRTLVSRTHFRKRRENVGGGDIDVWQWRWATKTADDRKIVGVGGEGYDRIDGAVNGFMSQQGIPGWEPSTTPLGMDFPDGYTLQKIADDHYVISKYETNNEDPKGE